MQLSAQDIVDTLYILYTDAVNKQRAHRHAEAQIKKTRGRR